MHEIIERIAITATRGSLAAYKHIHKFGLNPTLSSGGYESVWYNGGIYPWTAWDGVPKTVFVKSSSSSDNGNITVVGLDSNWNELTETHTITGTSPIQLVNQFRRISRALYTDGIGNLGSITFHIGTSEGTVVANIAADVAQTQMAIYTVPLGHTGYILNYTGSCGKNDDATLELRTREAAGEAFRLKSEMFLYQSAFRHMFAVPLVVPALTDIDFRAITTSSGSKIAVNFDIIIVDGRP